MSAGHLMTTMKYSDRHLAGLSAGPPTASNSRRGLSRLRDRPQLRLRANKLPSPNHCESRDFLLVNKNLSLSQAGRTETREGCRLPPPGAGARRGGRPSGTGRRGVQGKRVSSSPPRKLGRQLGTDSFIQSSRTSAGGPRRSIQKAGSGARLQQMTVGVRLYFY